MDILFLKSNREFWEALYIDGKLIKQSEDINIDELAREYNFNPSDIKVKGLSLEEEEYVRYFGFPDDIEELWG